MRRLAFILITLASVAFAPVSQAHADEPWLFAQITCVPELGYFAIRKFGIMNLPQEGPYLSGGFTAPPSVVGTLQSKYGIFDDEGLSKHPFICTVPHLDAVPGERQAFEVRVVGHFDKKTNNEADDYCEMVDSAEVIVNGKSVGSLVLNPCENGPSLVSVEVAHDGVALAVRRCTHDPFADHAAGGEQTVCRDEPLAKAQ